MAEMDKLSFLSDEEQKIVERAYSPGLGRPLL